MGDFLNALVAVNELHFQLKEEAGFDKVGSAEVEVLFDHFVEGNPADLEQIGVIFDPLFMPQVGFHQFAKVIGKVVLADG